VDFGVGQLAWIKRRLHASDGVTHDDLRAAFFTQRACLGHLVAVQLQRQVAPSGSIPSARADSSMICRNHEESPARMPS
jgi:hypothetical protein